MNLGQSAAKQRSMARACDANIWSHMEMAYLDGEFNKKNTSRPNTKAAGKMLTPGLLNLTCPTLHLPS